MNDSDPQTIFEILSIYLDKDKMEDKKKETNKIMASYFADWCHRVNEYDWRREEAKRAL